MSALRKPIQTPEQDAEVIYLVVPSQPIAPGSVAPGSVELDERLTLSERLGLALVRFQASRGMATGRSAGEWILAMTGVVALSAVAFYAAYLLKSAAGIDLFPNKHLEDFVPIPGWQRW